MNHHMSYECKGLTKVSVEKKMEKKHGKPEAYQCGGCALRTENIGLIKHHIY